MTATTPLLAVLALCAVLGLILLIRHAATLLPRVQGLAPPGKLRRGPLALEQMLPLDPRRRLLLVRCGARRVVLLTGGAQDVVVGWLDAEPPA